MNTHVKTAPPPGPSLIGRWIKRAGFHDEPDFVLRVVQPALVGMIDGTVSSLAPIFAAAIASSSHTALLVGFSTALGAACLLACATAHPPATAAPAVSLAPGEKAFFEEGGTFRVVLPDEGWSGLGSGSARFCH